MMPPPRITETLTGNARVRPAFRGRQVLQVEIRRESYRAFDFAGAQRISSWLIWRDADWQDMAALPGFTIGRPAPTEAKNPFPQSDPNRRSWRA
jgi:hypothetical protein